MPAPRLILCERDGKWAVAIRRFVGRGGAGLVETRLIDECHARLRDAPTAVVAVELRDDNVDGALELARRIDFDFPSAAVVVLAERGMQRYEPLLRELGAVHVVHGLWQISSAAPVIEHYLARPPLAEPSPLERLLGQLPLDWQSAD